MRLALAVSALMTIYIDPAEPDRFFFFTYLVLVLYTSSSASLLYLQMRFEWPTKTIPRWSHWIDVLWCLLISLSSGINSIFFFSSSSPS